MIIHRRHTVLSNHPLSVPEKNQILISTNTLMVLSDLILLSQEFKGHFTNRAAVVLDRKPLYD